jgi:hypothetical protein
MVERVSDFYISFASSDDGFLGATVVAAEDARKALSLVTELGLNPGGEAAIFGIPPDISESGRVQLASYRGRLVGLAELRANGALSPQDAPEVQDALDGLATIVCEDCNRG